MLNKSPKRAKKQGQKGQKTVKNLNLQKINILRHCKFLVVIL
jgi:hypothetical protein